MRLFILFILLLCITMNVRAELLQNSSDIELQNEKKIKKDRFFFEFGHMFLTGRTDQNKCHFATNIRFEADQEIDYSQMNLNFGFLYEIANSKHYSLFLKCNYLFFKDMDINIIYDMYSSISGHYQHIYNYNIEGVSSIIPAMMFKIYPQEDRLFNVFCGIGGKLSFYMNNTLKHTDTSLGSSNIDTKREPIEDVQHFVYTLGFGYKFKSFDIDLSISPALFVFEQYQDSYYAVTGTIFSTKIHSIDLKLVYDFN